MQEAKRSLAKPKSKRKVEGNDRTVLTEFDVLKLTLEKDNILLRLKREIPYDEKKGDEKIETADVEIPEKKAGEEGVLLSRQHWMPDRTCKVCYDCETPFTFFRRRHHCRICGQVFCNSCSSHMVEGSLYNIKGSVRVCNYCFDQQLWRIRDSAHHAPPDTPQSTGSVGEKEKWDADDSSKKNTPLTSNPLSSGGSSKPSLTDLNESKSKLDAEEKKSIGNGESEEENEEPSICMDSVILGSYSLGKQYAPAPPPPHFGVSGMTSAKHESGSKRERNKRRLEMLSHAHLKYVVSKLVADENLEYKWIERIMKLCRASVYKVKTSIRRGDKMDIRKYVKIKTISGGTPADSRFIQGVVFRKNIAHKHMKSKLRDAKILLLSSPIQFKGEHLTRGSGDRMSSLMTLIDQERMHLKMVVDKITRLRPDVVVVQKSVSRIAQDALREAGITLVLNVKPSIMERLARSTGAHILRSPDYVENTLLRRDQLLGYCKDFEVKVFREGKTTNTLMFFESSRSHRHGTICLRGAPKETLRAIKHVLRMSILVAYHLRLEVRFLDDECASYPEDVYFRMMSSYEEHEKTIQAAIKVQDASSPSQSSSKKGSRSESYKITPKGIMVAGELISMSPGIKINSKSAYAQRRAMQAYKGLGPLVVSISYGKFCRLTHNWQCEAPREEGHVFYEDTDQTLGRFLEEHCFDLERKCVNTKCRRNVLYHNRYLTHSSGRVHFTVKLLEPQTASQLYAVLRIKNDTKAEIPSSIPPETKIASTKLGSSNTPRDLSPARSIHACSKDIVPQDEKQILVCSFCRECDNRGPVVPLSEDAFNMSLGKFLDLTFHNHELRCRAGNCPHPLHRSYVRQFVKGNIIAQFQYDKIRPFKINFEPTLRYESSRVAHKLRKRISVLQKVTAALTSVFTERLRLMNKLLTSKLAVDEGEERHVVSKDLSDALAEGKSLQADIEKGRQFFMTSLARCTVDEKSFSKSPSGRGPSKLEVTSVSEGSANGDHATEIFFRLNSLEKMAFDSLHSWNYKLSRLQKPLRRSMLTFAATHAASAARDKKSASLDSTGDTDLQSKISRRRGKTVGAAPKSRSVSPRPTRESSLTDESKVESSSEIKYHVILGTPPDRESSLALPKIGELRKAVSASPRKTESKKRNWVMNAKVPSLARAASDGSGFRTSETEVLGLTRPITPKDIERKDSTLSIQRELEFFTCGSLLGTPEAAGALSAIIDEHNPDPSRVHLKLPELLNGVKVPIYRDEISSIIAYTLASKEHAAMIRSTVKKPEVIRTPSPRVDLNKDTKAKPGGKRSALPTASPSAYSTRATTRANSMSTVVTESTISTQDATKTTKGDIFTPSWYFTNPRRLRDVLLESPMQTFEHSFVDEEYKTGPYVPNPHTITSFTCKVFNARKFHALRKVICGNESAFIASMARCKSWYATGGKSGSTFAKTQCERYIIKFVSSKEFKMFNELAPSYFRFMAKACFKGLPTVLSKILGCYQITWKYKKQGRLHIRYAIVMPNVFYASPVTHVFDLKGSVRNRYVHKKPGEQGRVLLDENFLEYTRGFPIPIEEAAKDQLRHAVRNDSKFLCDQEIVDYSILVGLHETTRTMKIGIIDYVRQYTWERRIETGVKSMTGLASPTVINPEHYKVRFQLATERYFMMAPVQTSRAGLPALPPSAAVHALKILLERTLSPEKRHLAATSTPRAFAELVRVDSMKGEQTVRLLMTIGKSYEAQRPRPQAFAVKPLQKLVQISQMEEAGPSLRALGHACRSALDMYGETVTMLSSDLADHHHMQAAMSVLKNSGII